jgi:hypothetical protein
VQANKHIAQTSQAQLESATKQNALHHLSLANSDLAGGTAHRQTNTPYMFQQARNWMTNKFQK